MQFEEPPAEPTPLPPIPPDVVEPAPNPPQNIPQVFEGRLHPLTIVFGLVRSARVLLPMIPLVFFGRGWGTIAAFSVAAAGTIAATLVRYFSFRYRIERGELILESGLIERRHRSIPLDRVQEIRIEQGVVHRLLGVVDATVETGGGGGVEGKLSVLSRAEYERLRHFIFDRAPILKAVNAANAMTAGGLEPAGPPAEIVIRRLGPRDLIAAGLTSNHLLSALALAGALWNFADDLIPERAYRFAADYALRNAKSLTAHQAGEAILLGALAIFLIGLIGVVFSVAGTVLLFHGFTFSRRGDDLRRQYGLLTRRTSNLPRRRIQVLEVEEKMLRRLFGYATLRADTSGGKREHEDDNEGRDVLLPIARRDEIDGLLPACFPDFEEERAEWRQVSALAIRRGVIKGGIICLLAAVAFFAFRHTLLALWPLALVPLIWWLNVKSYRQLGYALGPRYLQTRRGWLGRSTHIVPIHKIQAVELHQTPFDRRLGLARLSIDTAGQAYTGGGPRIANLPIEEARAIARTLAQQAARIRYRW